MKKMCPKTKEDIINALKLIILFTVMVMGFWVIYAVIWFAVGLPQTNWAIWLLYVPSIASTVGYVKWLEN